MALPLPRVVADTMPGGGLITSNLGRNALAASNLENSINQIKAQYAPVTVPAEAASKLAYANLMGPQFLAKLMGNQDILANIPNQQGALNMVLSAATGQANNPFIKIGQPNPMAGQSPMVQLLMKGIKNMFGGGQNQISSQPQNVFDATNLSQADKSGLNNLQPGQSYTIQGKQPSGIMMSDNGSVPALPPRTTPNPNITFDAQGNPVFRQNAAQYAGEKEEGKKAGEIRATAIGDLSDVVFNARTKQQTLDNLGKIISSPEFEQMRQTPILGRNELQYYQRYGTPAQQNMVGQLVTLSGNIIRDASQDFKGAFRKGEQELIQNMKINPGDTFDAARGKMEQLSVLNQMIMNRAQLTANYMEDNHISKVKAEALADKQLNGDAMRAQVHNQLNPKPTESDINFMAQKYKTTPDEIKKRLKAKGLL